MEKTALLAGATGLVGGYVLEQLLDDSFFDKVIVISRRPLTVKHPKLEVILSEADALDQHADKIKADIVFCCLGTTIKKAGSQEAFKAIDYFYPLHLAVTAQKNGAQKYLLISALGANKHSAIFYNRVKGETEEAIAALHYPAFHILQPSLIMGERQEKRFGEQIAQKFSPVFNALMLGPLTKYKSIDAQQIAKAMLHYAKSDAKGTIRHENDELLKV
ncbi:MAG: oxidoreductase [Chitinophagales bacterium]|nr:oxidoreductase [Chitinophagales bacterium]